MKLWIFFPRRGTVSGMLAMPVNARDLGLVNQEYLEAQKHMFAELSVVMVTGVF